MDQRPDGVSRPALEEIRFMSEHMARTTSQPPSAVQVMALALRALQESEGVIARLKAELDQRRGTNVLLCMERDVAAAMQASADEAPGSVLRCTDTGREYEMTDRGWGLLADVDRPVI